jgi:ATP-dependent Clp protease ATP-binding subunit ClpA
VIQNEVETALARRLIAGDIQDGARVRIDAGTDGLNFEASRGG